MADPSQPSWMDAGAGGAPGSTPTPASGGTSDVERKRTIVRSVFRFFNAGSAVMMAATGALGIMGADNVDDTGIIFVALYMILFAAILFTFEMVQVYPCELMQRIYRRNFGFLFGTKGKALFIIFIAFLNFGLAVQRTLSLATGLVLIFLGSLQLIAYLVYPQYIELDNAKEYLYRPSDA
mmetsp:Transcript_18420/g.62478  ORF Transcript_18420/g.62478 Transcript_18420/m.62478 type:complete len:180 (+) Transcript_18420:56-595(+)|eukprot:CAMPEP_0198429396 /NCGR_PEP_ID=MMETSP1452-20131203/7332_1 /TAXON_ID=1181717 /ORGANISM="Synchroma pusillum, Strain CCMP3072" /LENGTH=179 /DNA_ID=CAMNT_0044149803 /DNA_START=42 /DNA_END=581 /DNA_ORIENTATION=+